MMGGLIPCPVEGPMPVCAPLMRLVFPAHPLAVREALVKVVETLREIPIKDDDCGTVEIVLAEVMNNIVEHAYGEDDPGAIELAIRSTDRLLCVDLADSGRPMPGGTAPEGHLADPGHTLERLPEGGFGWFLIRSIAEDLSYRREKGCNHLSFRLQLGHCPG